MILIVTPHTSDPKAFRAHWGGLWPGWGHIHGRRRRGESELRGGKGRKKTDSPRIVTTFAVAIGVVVNRIGVCIFA